MNKSLCGACSLRYFDKSNHTYYCELRENEIEILYPSWLLLLRHKYLASPDEPTFTLPENCPFELEHLIGVSNG